MLGPIQTVKKSVLINDYENIVVYSEKSEKSEGVSGQMSFVLNLFGWFEGWCQSPPSPQKLAIFILI